MTRKEVQRILNKKIVQLNDIIADIDHLLTEMETDFYRVCIFGSARIKPNSKHFKKVYQLAFELSRRGADIVTGGGPGLMQAANKGAKEGSKKSRSIGIAIDLPFESIPNSHLDVKRQHRRFSSRLDEFMRISHAVIVTPGGIGTILELFYTWQLIQVEHIKKRPIILLGGEGMWVEFLDWMSKWPVKMNLISKGDLKYLSLCKTVDSAIERLEPEIKRFYRTGKQR
jgi:uncharacterized protein (TIGR00730 family)